MFMTGELRITTAVSAALLVAGCGPKFDAKKGWNAAENTAVCTDQQGRRVEDRYCDRNAAYNNGYHHYGWYYMPRGAFVPPLGMAARGGSYSAPSGARYTPSGVSAAHISRGGFGSSAHVAAGSGG
jgi:hypothetical protein